MVYPLFKPRKLYRVSEILQYLEESARIIISRQTIHNYTMLGLINEATRTRAGHRLYAEDVFKQLVRIEMLKRHHTLREIRKIVTHKAASKK